jgi:hypothetical protein
MRSVSIGRLLAIRQFTSPVQRGAVRVGPSLSRAFENRYVFISECATSFGLLRVKLRRSGTAGTLPVDLQQRKYLRTRGHTWSCRQRQSRDRPL